MELTPYQKDLLQKYRFKASTYVLTYFLTFFTFGIFYFWATNQDTVLVNVCLFLLIFYILIQWVGLASLIFVFCSIFFVNWFINNIHDEECEYHINQMNSSLIAFCRPYPNFKGKLFYYPIFVLGKVLDLVLFFGFIFLGSPILAFFTLASFAIWFLDYKIKRKAWSILRNIKAPDENESMNELMDKLFNG